MAAGLLALLLVTCNVGSATAEWRALTPPGAGMTIEMPGEWVYKDNDLRDPELVAKAEDFVGDIRDVAEPLYIVTVFQLRPEKRTAMTERAIFDFGMALMAKTCKPLTYDVLTTAPGPAREITYKCFGDYKVRGRLHLNGDHLYRLSIGGPGGTADSGDAKRFLDSFRLVSE